MYNIRFATPEDFTPGILPMAEKFYKSTDYYQTMEWDVESIVEHYILMLTSGFVLVAEEEGKLVGMLGALVTPFPLNTKYMFCTESMWWVEDSHRLTGVGKDLVEAFENEAKTRGCKHNILSSLRTSPEAVNGYYKSKGYQPAETAYMRTTEWVS